MVANYAIDLLLAIVNETLIVNNSNSISYRIKYSEPEKSTGPSGVTPIAVLK